MDTVEPSAPLHGDLDEILKASERAAVLVRQLLAFSRKQVLTLETLDLNEVVEKLAKMIRRLIGAHITLTIQSASGPATIHADRGQIEQSVLNLCINARDAMTEGGELTIRIGGDDSPPDVAEPVRYVLLTVSDTGCGMDDKTKQRIFEPFFTTKGEGKGTGLGLATVYGIIRQHQGLIDVSSALGEGTTFTIRLPLCEDASEVEHAVDKTPPPGGTEVVLLAEDNEMVRTLARRLLENAGYTVLTATDGLEAIRMFDVHAREINLALLDVVMPGCGGRAVHDHIRQTDPSLPVLFASGYSTNGIHSDFVLEEGIELIQKPFERNVLLRAVRRLLDL